jgi:hypothetical protein
MKAIPALAAALSLSAGGAAQAAVSTDFTCRNAAAEITCSASGCEVNSDGFTPMSVSRQGDRLEVCAYSGCWSGALDLIRTRGDLAILHATLERGQGQAAVAYNRKDQTATMLWGNYALALSCGATP